MSIDESLVISIFPIFSLCVSSFLFSKADSPLILRLILLNLVIMSAAQALSYLSWPFSETLLFKFADIYLIAGYFLFTSMPVFLNTLSDKPISKVNYLYVAPVSLTVLHFSDFLIEGYRIEGSSPMHIDGPLAFLVDFYTIGCLVALLFIVFSNLRESASNVLVSKNLLFILSLIPLQLLFSMILLLSMTMYAVPVIFVGPIISIYAALVFSYLSKPSVLNLSIGFSAFYRKFTDSWHRMMTELNDHDLGNSNMQELHDSLFVSYGGPDEAFAAEITKYLNRNGVETWFFPHDAVPGQKLHRVMHDGINQYDRVLLICSKASLSRKGVLNELERALEREAKAGGTEILIPITIDNYVFSWNPNRQDIADQVRSRVITIFTSLDPSNQAFAEAASKLLKSLKHPP